MTYMQYLYNIIQSISRLGALSTRICIILTKSFHIIHTRAQSLSANILYRMECLLLEPGSVYEKLFHNIHTKGSEP